MHRAAVFAFDSVLVVSCLLSPPAGAAETHVPMTREPDCPAVLDGIGGNATFLERAGGRILHSSGGASFRCRPTGG